MLSEDKPLAFLIFATVVLCLRAIVLRFSPFCTLCDVFADDLSVLDLDFVLDLDLDLVFDCVLSC